MMENEKEEVNGNPGTDSGRDLEKELADERKASAGKDSKISKLLKENSDLSESHNRALADISKSAQAAVQLAELSGKLKAREAELERREAALNYGIEHHLPVSLTVANADRLADLEKEIGEIVKATMAVSDMRNREMAGKSKYEQERIAGRYDKADPLKLYEFGKLNPREAARVPDSILAKMRGGK